MTAILIQHVHTLWTKRSRGGDGARIRSSVPHAVMLPTKCTGYSGWILHIATYAERDQFGQSDRCDCANDFQQLGIHDLDMHFENGALAVRFYRDGNNAARPSPLPFSDLPMIQRNQCIRLRYNGRYVDRCNGNWWYEQSCYNIGWFDSFANNVFLTTTPSNEFVEMAALR